jgi:D-alanyl-D-alanine carboxypeptidase
MNNAADAYNMKSTSYVEPTGISDGNLSTANDLFRLANYILNKKSFIFDITGEKTKVITSNDGSAYEIVNLNESLEFDPYVGGMAGFTTSQQDVMLSLLRLKIGAEKRTIVIVVLGSKNAISDSGKLADWITEASASGAQKGSACVTCATQNYRKIDLP